MLAPLRALVRDGDFTRLAYRIAAAGVISRSDGRYLAGRAFALITNNYPPFLVDKVKLGGWVQSTSADWSPAVERAAADPDRLPGLVDAMLSELKTWQPRSGRETGTPA